MLIKLLENNVKRGVINLHMPDGKTYRFGNEGLEANWIVKSNKVMRRIAKD